MPVVQNPSLGLLIGVSSLTSGALLQPGGFDLPLVNAPGANKVIVPFLLAVEYTFGTHPYQTQAVDQIVASYGVDPNVVLQQPPLANMITASSSQFAVAMPAFLNPNPASTGAINKQFIWHSGDLTAGPLLTASVQAGGAGYAVNDTGLINDGLVNPSYKVTAIGGGGAVTAFTITSPGTACIAGQIYSTTNAGAQPGVGAGFTVFEQTVQQGDGTLKGTLYYQILSVP